MERVYFIYIFTLDNTAMYQSKGSEFWWKRSLKSVRRSGAGGESIKGIGTGHVEGGG